jgi:hypothetical protein
MSVSGLGGRSAFQIQSLLEMRAQLDNLQRQLGTGQKSDTYAGLGLDRGLSVSLRSQLGGITSFQQTIDVLSTRLGIAQNALTAIDKSAHSVKSSTAITNFSIDQSGQTNEQQAAFAQLDQMLAALNTRVGDQYIFSGKSPDLKSVDSIDNILNGNGLRAGLRQLISERTQADLGTSGLGRLTLPPIVSSAASLVGSGATILPDAVATVSGSQNIGGAYASAGGTLVINGTTIPIGAGANAAAVLAAINAPAVVAATGVTASLNGSNQLVLTSANADTAIDVGAGSTLLGEFGLGATTTNPTNLLTQGVVTAGQTLTVTIGARPPLTITFGTNGATIPPEVSTLAELNAQLATLVGNGAAAASVNPVNGNITITASTTGESIVVGGNANAAAFGLATTSASPSNTVTISEDAAGHPFGFKLASASSTLTGTTVTPGGPPASYTIDIAGNPQPGESASLTLNLPDGTTETIKLTATAATPPGPNEFTIGATSDVTAANFKTALTTAVTKLAGSSLAAASAITVSNNFFNVDATTFPQRVVGPPFDTATALTAGTAANTEVWYLGEAGTTPARSTAFARVDTTITASFGMRANEQGIRNAVSGVAAFAALTFSASDPNAAARYAALAQRVGVNLDNPQGVQKIPDIEAEIANAQTAMTTATDRHQQTKAALSGLLDTVSGVTQEQVGSEILALQTRLQASLQTTALLSKISLVNYLT